MRKKFLIILILVFLLSFICLECYGQLANTPWPKFRQNLQNTGMSNYEGPDEPFLKWKYTTGSSINSSPAIGLDGTIYVGSGDYYLYAINPDGTLKWKFPTGDYVESSPTIGLER